MTFLVLSAGQASRLGGICKALQVVAGRTMAVHQSMVVGEEPIVVARPEHAMSVRELGVRVVVSEESSGPGQALSDAMTFAPNGEPVTVAFADTYFSELPEGGEWCAVGLRPGGRRWDVVYGSGRVRYQFVPPPFWARVCAGLYRFADAERLRAASWHARWRAAALGVDASMGMVLGEYGAVPFVDLPSWQDVGDSAALAAFKEVA